MKKIILSITRNPKLFAVSIFFGLTSIWALFEPFVTVYFTNINKYWFVLFLTVPSIIIAFTITYPKRNIRIELRNTNTIVNIKFGDLFMQHENIAIGVNEYFDSQLGKLVSEKSLHGLLIKNILGGKKELFDKAVDESLKQLSFEEINRELGKNRRYPIGSTACLNFGDKNYLLFALTKTNSDYESYTNPSLLIKALNGLLSKARSECNGRELNLPLFGTGLGRLGLEPKLVVDLILIAILDSAKQREITNVINIIIHDSLFDKIDLNDIKRKWN